MEDYREWPDGEALRAAKIGRQTKERLLTRSCEGLLGLCEGMMSDGVLTDSEIRYLGLWLEDHAELASTWPGEVLYARVREVLADGVITDKERAQLEETLRSLLGSRLEETGAVGGMATTLPVEIVDRVRFKGRLFCFTGTFLFGTRAACERAVEKRGGMSSPRVRMDLDYLVIGTMTTPAWANTSFGRKIEKAVEYNRERGCDVKIISEKDWAKDL